MGGKIIEKAVIIGTLPIFKAFELNMSGLFLFCLVDFFARVAYIARIDGVENEQLQSPDDISAVFYVAALLETLEGNRLRVVRPVERADDDKGSVGVTLEFL